VSYRWPFFVALTASFLFFFSFQMLLAPFPLFVQSIGGTPADLGLVMGVFALTAVLSRPLAGWLADSKGRRIGLIIGGLIFTVSFVLYAVVKSLKVLIPLRLFHGTGIAFFTTAYIALISDLAPPDRRGEALGLAAMASPLSLLVSPLVGAYLAKGGHFSRLFLASAGVSALSLALSSLLPETLLDAPAPKKQRGFAYLFHHPYIWLLISITITVAVTYGAVISFLPVFVEERGVGNAGLFFSAFAFTLLVIQVAAGRLSDRVGRRAVAVPAIGLLALSMALTARLNSQASLLLAAVIYGLGYGATRTSIDATIVDKVVKGARGTAMGLNYAGFDFGIGMGSFLLGLVAEMWNYQVMYASIAGLCLLVGLIFLVLS